MAAMADDNEKSIKRVTKIEDVLPYKHIPTAKVLSKRRLLLRSLLFEEQHAVLQHMFSHCYPTEHFFLQSVKMCDEFIMLLHYNFVPEM